MISPQPRNYSGDGTLVQSVMASNFSIAESLLGAVPDIGNLFVGELSHKSVPFAVGSRVEVVPNARNPLKVSDRIVGLNQIDVVDFGKIERVRKKSSSYKPVNGNVSALASLGMQENLDVSPISCTDAHHASGLKIETTIFGPTKPGNAPHMAKATDFVIMPECFDANRSPFFNDWGKHGVDRPSAEVGLAFENPSRASTLGGFAIDSKTPPAKQDIGGVFCR